MKKDDPMYAEAYASGVLKPDIHDRLVADLENFAADAAIKKRFIWTSLLDECGAEEITYAKAFRSHKQNGVGGFVLTGPADNVEDRFSALAGFLVRNFIRARVFTLAQFLENGAEVDLYSAVLIPNFFVKGMGGVLPEWKAGALLDVLVARHLAGKQTFVYASDLKGLAVAYGDAFKQLFERHFQIIKAA